MPLYMGTAQPWRVQTAPLISMGWLEDSLVRQVNLFSRLWNLWTPQSQRRSPTSWRSGNESSRAWFGSLRSSECPCVWVLENLRWAKKNGTANDSLSLKSRIFLNQVYFLVFSSSTIAGIVFNGYWDPRKFLLLENVSSILSIKQREVMQYLEEANCFFFKIS